MTMTAVERHPLEPFIPDGARLLMLGSFPPARERWCMDFFYPNYTNDMWRVFGIVFHGDKDYFCDVRARTFRKTLITDTLRARGIALYDTARAVIRTRNTAADKDLQIVETTDIGRLTDRMPQCTAVAATGGKAADVITAYLGIGKPAVGNSVRFTLRGRDMTFWRMPSTSRAYPMSPERKAEAYSRMFDTLN